MNIVTGSLTGLFAYDVGYEIDLERLQPLAAGHGARLLEADPARAALRGSGRAIDLECGARRVALPDGEREARLVMRVYDFGAVSVMMHLPLAGTIEALGPFMASLVRTKTLESIATAEVRALVDVVLPAIIKPGLTDFLEDFYVIQVDRLETPLVPEALRRDYAAPIALALRCEKESLTEGEADEVFRTAVSYHPDELVVTDWNAAFVYAARCPGLLDALEFLNVQLVELRFFDRRLDARMSGFMHAACGRPRLRTLVLNPFTRALDEVAELKVETTIIAERVGNALKFIDDLYLARVYAVAAERLRLEEWRSSVDSKLRVVHEIYDLLNGRAATYRAEALELTIVLLIVIEIVLSFVR